MSTAGCPLSRRLKQAWAAASSASSGTGGTLPEWRTSRGVFRLSEDDRQMDADTAPVRNRTELSRLVNRFGEYIGLVSVPSLLRVHPEITFRYCTTMPFVFKTRRGAYSRPSATVAATWKTDEKTPGAFFRLSLHRCDEHRASKIGSYFWMPPCTMGLGSPACTHQLDILSAVRPESASCFSSSCHSLIQTGCSKPGAWHCSLATFSPPCDW